jgi:hypothetical protein
MHTLLQKDQLAPGAAVTALLPEILSGLYLQQQPCSTCLFLQVSDIILLGENSVLIRQ